jgi:HJR/Mrr/RecB family endonuclease
MTTIAVLVSHPEMHARVRSAVMGRASVRVVGGWDELRRLVEGGEVNGIVADVQADLQGNAIAQIEGLRSDHPDLPLVVYTQLSPMTAQALMHLGRAGIRRVVVHRFEDTPGSLLRALAAEGVAFEDDSQAPTLDPRIVLNADSVSDRLIRALAQQPELIYTLAPRTFEELVADLLAREGYSVSLTSATRDGGKDILVACTSTIGSFAYYVECKRFAKDRAVGVPIIRELYGAVQADRVTGGIVATTSFFTKDALAFQSKVPYQIALRDFNDLTAWLARASGRSNE